MHQCIQTIMSSHTLKRFYEATLGQFVAEFVTKMILMSLAYMLK